MFNLLLVPSSVFFILDTVVPSLKIQSYIFYVYRFMFCLFCSFLNIESTVIIGLMFMSPNIVCAVSWLALIGFFSHYGLCFLAFCIPGNFFIRCQTFEILLCCWVQDFFCISLKNIFWALFWNAVKLLGNSGLSDLAWLLGQYHFALLHCWGKTLFEYSGSGNRDLFLAFCPLWVVFPLILLSGSFTVGGWFLHTYVLDKYSAKDLRDNSADLWILSSSLLGALLCIWRSPCRPQAKFCVLDSGRPLCSASGSSFLFCGLENLSRQ